MTGSLRWCTKFFKVCSNFFKNWGGGGRKLPIKSKCGKLPSSSLCFAMFPLNCPSERLRVAVVFLWPFLICLLCFEQILRTWDWGQMLIFLSLFVGRVVY